MRELTEQELIYTHGGHIETHGDHIEIILGGGTAVVCGGTAIALGAAFLNEEIYFHSGIESLEMWLITFTLGILLSYTGCLTLGVITP